MPGTVFPIRVIGEPCLASAFAVDECAARSIAAACMAAAALEAPTRRAPLVLDRGHIAAAFAGRYELDGVAPTLWADLSGYYRTRHERWLQLHCNFPHHATGVAQHLGFDTSGGSLPERPALEARILERDADELEAELIERGMIAAKLRSLEEWAQHPHAAATRDLPLISWERIGGGTGVVGSLDGGGGRTMAPNSGPLAGLRVLDCSRVLAGPVAGRTLAAHGADVLRLGAAKLPSVEPGVILTGMGKRNANLDLDEPGGVAHFEALLAGADVWIDAFRPGAFERRGLTPGRAAELRPGIVVVQISAFDWVGPWAGRRGFDSIVQSTTGIVDEGTRRAGADAPLPLPVQALDFATGYLAAFAAMQLVAHRAREGGSWLARLSLLGTRNWLTSLAEPKDFAPERPTFDQRFTCELDSDFGRLTLPRPLAGRWRSGPTRLGSSPAAWR